MLDDSIIFEIKKATEEVPFHMSQYQIEHMIVNQETLERQYRNVLLQMDVKINTLSEIKFRRDRFEIDIEEIKEKLLTAESFNKKRLEIDLKEKEYSLQNELKLINDCVFEVAKYYQKYKELKLQLPDMTREKFELAEDKYWKARFQIEAKREVQSMGRIEIGTLASLDNVGLAPTGNEKGQLIFVEKEKPELLEGKKD